MKASGKVSRSVAAVLGCLLAFGAAAQTPVDPLAPHIEGTLYFGRGADSNLRDMPRQIVNGEVPWENTHFTAVGLTWAGRPPEMLDRGLSNLGWQGATTGVEVVASKHRGMQDIWELGVLALLRSPFAHLGPVRARIGAGIGLSYTFGTPTYEDGSADEPNRRWRFQNYNAFEIEAGIAQFPATTLVARVHHRSGLYGLLAPRQVGSNFVALAVRHQF